MDAVPAPATLAVSAARASADVEADRRTVAELDVRFQAAVKRNDAQAIDAILHDDFLLVLGDGRRVTRTETLDEARNGDLIYTVQDEEPGSQSVLVAGDTAVVTAKLAIKGRRREGGEFDRTLWFSDTYVRTPHGWKYLFGQASLPLLEG